MGVCSNYSCLPLFSVLLKSILNILFSFNLYLSINSIYLLFYIDLFLIIIPAIKMKLSITQLAFLVPLVNAYGWVRINKY